VLPHKRLLGSELDQRIVHQSVQDWTESGFTFSLSRRLVMFVPGVKPELMLQVENRNVQAVPPSNGECLWLKRRSLHPIRIFAACPSAKITQIGTFLYHGSVPTRAPKKAKLTILRARHLRQLPWLVHGFSTRVGGLSRAYGKGNLNLGFTEDDARAAVEGNRTAFLREIGAVTRKRGGSRNALRNASGSLWPLITLRQIHSDIIRRVDSIAEQQLTGDGLITATAGLLLAIQTADCLPVILVDGTRHVVGVFHAGWRGTAKRIVEKGVGEMHRWFGSRPRDLKAAIGPGIQGCCYEVGEEVRIKFESQFAYGASLFREVKDSDPVREKYPLLFLTARAPGHGELPNKIFLDLVEANRQQLLAAGLPAKGIEVSPLCTNCHPELLFSYRAEKGKTGRLMGVAGIRG
jgi:YfiH family protein